MNKTFLAALLVICALLAVAVNARNYAVLVCGSHTYSNYRHGADISHHYRVLIEHGYQPEDIITFYYDDVARSNYNPFPGSIYNTPAPNSEGIDYYAGIKLDYTGADVTPQNFLSVLVGNQTTTGGPTLQTGPNDNILISMDDHGAPGLFAFPTKELYVQDFKKALDHIVAYNKAAKVAIYIESCESGSMCDGVINPGSPIICNTASDGKQSSWGKWCGSEAVINGKSINSCLADEFAWGLSKIIDEEGVDMTVGDFFQKLKIETTKSPAQWFAGDESFKNWKLSEFFTQVGFTAEQNQQLIAQKKSMNVVVPKSTQFVSSRDMSLHFLTQRYLDVNQELNMEERSVAGEELLQELTHRLDTDKRFTRIASKVLQNLGVNSLSAAQVHTMDSEVLPVNCGNCCVNAYNYISNSQCKFSDYSLKFGKTIHNLCTMKKNTSAAIMAALQQECQH